MADLPSQRTDSSSPPFTYVGADYFGPIMVKNKGKVEKRYGCLFTCLVTRAVHLEVSRSLDVDSFLLALRRLISRRGKMKEVFSDNGTNFRAGNRELRAALRQWNLSKIEDKLTQDNIQWHFLPPSSPHFGGAWERLVRSTKRAMEAVLGSRIVDDESLTTVLAEIEAVLNSRPLTHVSTCHEDLEALTPFHFLIGRASPNLPPGIFEVQDLSCRRRWRQAQTMCDHFWRRWRKEYLPTLSVRHKWKTEQRNLKTGDLVIVVQDNAPRSSWTLGRVVRPVPGTDGRVRAAEVRTSRGIYTRPVAKLCVLEESV